MDIETQNIIIDDIVTSLQDLQSLPCTLMVFVGGLLSGSAASINPGGTTPDMYDERILSSAFRFFTAPRSRTEMDRILRAPCACPVEIAQDDPLHTWAQDAISEGIQAGRFQWPLQVVFAQFFTFIFAATNYNQSLRRRSYPPHLEPIKPTNVWPKTLRQVLPYGAEDTMRALLGWFNVDIGATNVELLVRVVTGVFGYTSQVTLPYMIASPAFISRGILPLLQRGCDLMTTSLSQAVSAFETCQTALFSITVHWCGPTHRRVLLEGHAVALLTACDRAVQLMASRTRSRVPSRRIAELQGKLDTLARALGTFAGMLMQDMFWWTQGKVAYKFSGLSAASHLNSYFHRVLSALEYSSEGGCCGSPECTQSSLDVASLRLCGGCRRVTYCSRRCQKIAWRHLTAPHRRVCDPIRRVCEENAVPRTRIKVLKLNKTSISERFDEMLGEHIAEHFDALVRYRMVTFSSMHIDIPNWGILLK
jgi:hypothetical protein